MHGVDLRADGGMLSTIKRECQAPLNTFFAHLTNRMSAAANLRSEERLRPAIRPGRSAYLDMLHEISDRLSEIALSAEFPAGP